MRLSPLAILTHLIPECRVKKRWLIGLEWTRALTSQKAMDALSVTYILRANQPGAGSHVANAAFMVAPDARGTWGRAKHG